MSANQQDGEEIFFLFLRSFTFHAKNLLWLDCHSRFFYKLKGTAVFTLPFLFLYGSEAKAFRALGPQTGQNRSQIGKILDVVGKQALGYNLGQAYALRKDLFVNAVNQRVTNPEPGAEHYAVLVGVYHL